MRSISRVLCALAVLAASALGCTGERPAAGAARKSTAFVVETARAERRDVNVTLRAVGTVKPAARADIRPQVDGVVARVHFQEGAPVAEGDLLVDLDDRKAAARLALAEAALDSARARLRVAERLLGRHRQLFAEQLIAEETFETTEAEYLEAEAAVREQEAAVELARRELEDYHVRAPFDGVVGARLVDEGNYVETGTTLVILQQTDPVEIVFQVPDKFAVELRLGAKVSIRTRDGGKPFEGNVAFIDPRIDETTRMLSARARVPNPNGRLRAGQLVDVEMLLDVRRAQVVVPEEAILAAGGRTWVFVVGDGRAERRDVTLGERLPPLVEVLSGVDADEVIVVAGQHRLRDGAEVETRPRDGA